MECIPRFFLIVNATLYIFRGLCYGYEMTAAGFRKVIWEYYRRAGRRLPWRETRDPYRILVSEVMLQQTQVARVVGFYENFIKKFPSFAALAEAKTADVLRAWQGLGYNRRALALQRLAVEVVGKHGGKLPRDRESLISLPGVGPYTAGAIRAFALNEPEIFIETNIRRVFIHFFFPKRKKSVTDAELTRYLKRTLDEKRPREWYWALIDYGAMLGEAARSSSGLGNPNRRSAHYVRQAAFKGSNRELRGKILRILLERRRASLASLGEVLKNDESRVGEVITSLAAEGFIKKRGAYVEIIS